MSRFRDALRCSTLLADGALGSYIFELTGRLSEENHVYEALNTQRPDVIRDAYFAYLNAGSRCLTTNTFAGNADCLTAVGLQDQVGAIAGAGVAIAVQALADFDADGEDRFVLGSIGPTRTGTEVAEALPASYEPQIRALIDGGADALLLETFRSLDHLRGVLALVRQIDGTIPVISHMSLLQSAGVWTVSPDDFVQTASDEGADVVGINCCPPWDADAFVDTVQNHAAVVSGNVLLSAMPNAGGLQHIGNRYMTRVNPEYMGQLARTLSAKGAALVGGCCEIHPAHVWEMNNYLQSRSEGSVADTISPSLSTSPVTAERKRDNGAFSRKIFDGEFAVSVEMLPSRGTAPKLMRSKIDFVGQLAASGLADALDITDGSRGIPLIPPGDFIHLVRQGLGWSDRDGLELIPHFTARDLNVMGVQARLVGYWANGIHNAIFITGDPPKMAPTYPPSTGVFDLNSVDMIHLAHARLNAGLDFGGQPLGRHRDPRTHFTIGTGFEPEALDGGSELAKLHRKLDAGADYVMTQPAFRWEPLDVLREIRQTTPVLIGVLVLRSLDHARRMRDVPGVLVPDEVLDRFAATDDPAAQARIGQQFASEQIQHIRSDGWSGVYLMSPGGHAPILDVLRAGLS